MTGGSASLNENQQRRLRVTCEHIDRLFGEVEAVLEAAHSRAAFPRYLPDLVPGQRRLLADSIARARAQLGRVLAGQGIAAPAATIPASRAIRTTLTFVDIAAEELGPKYMRGYGALAPAAEAELRGVVAELKSLAARMDRLVAEPGVDWRQRLDRLADAGNDVQLLRRLEAAITGQALVELRPALGVILDRLEDQNFEIAVFGRVSSGKSSLLNAILAEPILPVGVTPVTAVPTRIAYATTRRLLVWRADHPVEIHALEQLAGFVSEELNPGNRLHVSRILAELPAPRLSQGVVLVDTPGLGSLALAGGEETLAYLPRCDLGVMLVDAGSTLTPDDLSLVHRLSEAAIPAAVLLSKADLLSAEDRARLSAYVAARMGAELGGRDCPVWPVSSRPEYRELLSDWFRDQIEPLFSRRQELRETSLRRKIGALRESVEAALRARLRGRAAAEAQSGANPAAAEAELRRAAAEFEPARAQSRETTLRLAGAAPELLQSASQAVLRAAGDAAPARAAVLDGMRAAASAIAGRWREAAGAAAAGLRAAAQLLGQTSPEPTPFASALRELPPAELPPGLLAGLPRPTQLLGRGVATSRMAGQLRRRYEPELAGVLETYAHLLDAWSDGAGARLEAEFNTIADPLRAQAQRLQADAAGGADRAAVQSQLAELAGAPGGERP